MRLMEGHVSWAFQGMYSSCEKMEKFQSEMQLALHLIFLVLPRSHQAIRRPDPDHAEPSLSSFFVCRGLWGKAAKLQGIKPGLYSCCREPRLKKPMGYLHLSDNIFLPK